MPLSLTADLNKGQFPSKQTVKSILDNNRGSTSHGPLRDTVKSILDNSRTVPQPTGNARVRPIRTVTPGTQSSTLLSPAIPPNQMTSFIVVPTPAPIPNTNPNVTVVTTPVVNQSAQSSQQQAHLNPQMQPKSVKVIDLTVEEEASRNLANRGVALSVPQNQVLVPTGPGLPQGLILGNPAGTSILRNGQPPAYQIVFSSTSQPIRQGSILTLATPVPSPGMRPAVAGTSMVTSTSSSIATMPQLKPGQSTTTSSNPRHVSPVVTPVQQRPPPPLQCGVQNTNVSLLMTLFNIAYDIIPRKTDTGMLILCGSCVYGSVILLQRVASTSLATMAPPPLLPQHPAPLPPVTTVVASGQKPLPPKPSLKISRVSQGE